MKKGTLTRLCMKKEKTLTELSKDIQIDYQKLWRWDKKVTSIRLSSLQKILDYFGITVKEFIEIDNETKGH